MRKRGDEPNYWRVGTAYVIATLYTAPNKWAATR